MVFIESVRERVMGISDKRIFGFLECGGGAMGYECVGHGGSSPVVLIEFLQIYLRRMPQVPITWVHPWFWELYLRDLGPETCGIWGIFGKNIFTLLALRIPPKITQ